MTSRRRFLLLASSVLAVGLTGVPFVTVLTGLTGVRVAAASLPARLSDQEFWRLSSESSEQDGFFQSDNLLSNESGFQYVVPELARTAKAGRVYMGVGPEQNFTYIVATKPAMVFIVDIRRGNLDLQLMYKALFELSANRAEFVSRLFARERPAGLTATSSAIDIFEAVRNAARSDAIFDENLQAMADLLVRKHGFGLSADDLRGVAYVYNAFYEYGPKLQYSSTGSFPGVFTSPTYADLMAATDGSGVAHSYLASEENFQFIKDLQGRNMLVPVIGNFGGSKALRAVGKYLKDTDATVSAFYLSNVEQYLRTDGIWGQFCSNVASLPIDETSTFIRSVPRVGVTPGLGLVSQLGNMASEVKDCRP